MSAKALPELPVFYATTEGQSERIALRLRDHLLEHGLASEALAIAGLQGEELDWSAVRGLALCASIHHGDHQRVARDFARAQRGPLTAVPSLFVSVSLAAHSTDREEQEAAAALAASFGERSGWRASRIASVAGSLAYTRYGWLKRWMMRRISKAEGGPTDTSRDHEFTDWAQVERLAKELAEAARGQPATPSVR